jgi:hypothetical protein
MQFYYCVALILVSLSSKGQGDIPVAAPYGKVELSDLVMTSCDFEKDANAEILFDKGIMKLQSGQAMERHIRIKIFNDFGKKSATVHLLFHSGFPEGKSISGLDGENINLEGTKVVTTPLDKSQIYIEHLNKKFSEYVFTFPSVKAGLTPIWLFQNDLPTRYSEIQTVFVSTGSIMVQTFNRQPVVSTHTNNNDPTQIRYMTNVHSLPDEPYTTARIDNLDRAQFVFSSGLFFNNWSFFVDELIKSKAFGDKLGEPLPGEEAILKKSDGLKNDEQRIAFIFDTVKTLMKWNKKTFYLASDT